MSIAKENEAPAPLPIGVAEESKKVPVTREELVVATAPLTQQAEQFRALRNSIHALNPDGAPRTVVVTSALRGEGKSTATLNLAFALAEMPGFKVLVIDANLHAPAIEGLFGLPRAQGLCELLSGRLPLDQAVRPTSVSGVAILGPGSKPRNPSELLASDRMRTLLRTLKQRYHYVLIDTPEATTTSDASLLGAMADGVVVVVRVATTPKSYVEQTCRALESLGANLLGTCMTGADAPNTARQSPR
ncbi:MAG: CpsD/CapB family tyrosine-protein kinase [Planctomycetes bacterium]|nr:CpsD/CapB family tyrosine-protein kinase [Planctomycetota bacterium]